MNVLAVYAHPNPNSFNAAILDHVVRGLKERGFSYTVVDLYKDNFNPVLIVNDQFRRRDMMNDPEMASYRNLISQADHLIFIYPVWWYGAPAIMKGFFDRVLASGFAYEYNGLLPKGLLKGKSTWVIYTIDSPWWYVKIWRRSAEWEAIGRATLKFCGLHPVKRFMFAGVKGSSKRRRDKWLDSIYHRIKNTSF